MKVSILLSYILASTSAFSTPKAPQLGISSSTRLYEGDTDGADEPTVGAEAISALTKDVKTIFSSEDIDKILPHRYPFALVDKVIEYEAGKRAVGVKTVTKNEPHFNGHFPERPIMPGVLQVEALAQLAGIICLQMEGASPGSVFFFAGVNGVKWKKPVIPGDVLVMEVEVTKWKAKFGIAKATGRGYVDGALAVEVKEMTFALAK
eukprot:CAMPEP_0194130782 /NCGR_PEP_ID=MMETSP0152-20130528/1737_1 /TAXON_ID=1049557 /ORGANISM="Thalassiothrix antarctica, Strain L6-D1" /LENGTH=205 /DNA_ID=CAMNT_0038825393 /DNA_START=79 /DNA_END=696 /DNA_ORIENTATION=+